MQIVPTKAVPNQTLQIQLDGQPCTINIYQQAYGLYVDLYVAEVLIIAGVIVENLNRIVRSLYLGFSGDLMFVDNDGSNDPVYTGLGSRYFLVYVAASDLPAGVG